MSELKKKILEKAKQPVLAALATITEDGKPWVRYITPWFDKDLTIWDGDDHGGAGPGPGVGQVAEQRIAHHDGADELHVVEGRDDAGIGEGECGMAYTDEKALIKSYGKLLDGSMNHLRAYVAQIEKTIGEGNYVAQYLTQEEVDEILGR